MPKILAKNVLIAIYRRDNTSTPVGRSMVWQSKVLVVGIPHANANIGVIEHNRLAARLVTERRRLWPLGESAAAWRRSTQNFAARRNHRAIFA